MLLKPDEYERLFCISVWTENPNGLLAVEFSNFSGLVYLIHSQSENAIFKFCLVWKGPRGLLSVVVAMVCSSYCLDYVVTEHLYKYVKTM